MLRNVDTPVRFVAIMIVVTLLFAIPAMSVASLQSSPGAPACSAVIAAPANGSITALADWGPHSLQGSVENQTMRGKSQLLANDDPRTIRRSSPLRTSVAPHAALTPLRI